MSEEKDFLTNRGWWGAMPTLRNMQALVLAVRCHRFPFGPTDSRQRGKSENWKFGKFGVDMALGGY
jgi:hypothetical protein